jgi:hypothetical protein
MVRAISASRAHVMTIIMMIVIMLLGGGGRVEGRASELFEKLLELLDCFRDRLDLISRLHNRKS